MSLTSAMNSAVSGLSVTSRLADLASTNIANAATPGYVRRQAEVSSSALGGQAGGVSLTGIRRDVSTLLLNDIRVADAAVGDRDARLAALTQIEDALGIEGDDSLTGKIATLDSALIAAAGRPEAESRLQTVLSAMQGVVSHLSQASQAVQTVREGADAAIASQVETLNTTLSQVKDLNSRILTDKVAGRDTSALEDLRQKQVDSIASIVPIRQVARDNGVVALYSLNGAPLLDGKASVFGFEPTRAISAEMTIEDGPLSGLTLNGHQMGLTDRGLLAGGSLIAQFAIRDTLATEAQAHLDGVAREVVERFQNSAVDPTLAPGQAGVFTDAGAAFLAANEVGLSSRLAINAAVDPDQGGGVWRLRDGVGAATPGPVGESSLLTAMQGAVARNAVPASAALSPVARSLGSLASDLVSSVARDRVETEDLATFARTKATSLQEKAQAQGVDTDQELQNLLLIEQAYAANARVIQTIDTMLSTLMEL